MPGTVLSKASRQQRGGGSWREDKMNVGVYVLVVWEVRGHGDKMENIVRGEAKSHEVERGEKERFR